MTSCDSLYGRHDSTVFERRLALISGRHWCPDRRHSEVRAFVEVRHSCVTQPLIEICVERISESNESITTS